MEAYGATVHASPTNLTNAGRGILEQDPDSNGSLGISISEAVEDAATHDDDIRVLHAREAWTVWSDRPTPSGCPRRNGVRVSEDPPGKPF